MRKTCLKPLEEDHEPNKAGEYKPKKRIRAECKDHEPNKAGEYKQKKCIIAECKKEITHGYFFL
jgi:hypothetical protein